MHAPAAPLKKGKYTLLWIGLLIIAGGFLYNQFSEWKTRSGAPAPTSKSAVKALLRLDEFALDLKKLTPTFKVQSGKMYRVYSTGRVYFFSASEATLEEKPQGSFLISGDPPGTLHFRALDPDARVCCMEEVRVRIK